MNRFKSDKGSYTLETAITFSIIFMVILLLIYLSYVLYEQVRINAIALETAERGAIVYPYAEKDMYTGRIGTKAVKANNVYWRALQGFFSNDAAREAKVKDYALLKLNAYATNKSEYPDSAVEIEFKNFLFYRTVIVRIDVAYQVPLGGIFRYFGIQSPYPIKGYAMAAVNEPAEMIRTVDLVTDFALKFEAVQNMSEKYKKGIAKLRDWIHKEEG